MARSLHVKHEETLSLSPLFVGFLLLSVICLVLSAATGWADPAVDAAPAAQVVTP